MFVVRIEGALSAVYSVNYVRVNDSGGSLEDVVSSHSETSSCDEIM